MAGWEQLTPNEIITLAWMGMAMVLILTFGTIFKSLVMWRISRSIQVKIDQAVEKSVTTFNLYKWLGDIREKHKLRKQKEQEMINSGYDPKLEKFVK